MRTRTRRLLVGTALGLMASPLAGSLSLPSASAAAGDISNIDFAAPLSSLYDHSTGGGYYADGSVSYVKNELLGEDFACGDLTTFLAYFETAAVPVAAVPFAVTLSMDFTTDSTGQSGVALFPVASSARVNTGDPALVPATPTAAVTGTPTVTSSGTAYTSGATETLTFTVGGLGAGQSVVVRVDARIGCEYQASPTGNLQASLDSALVLDPPNEPEEGGSGAQTINFRNVNNLTNLGEPVLEVTKSVTEAGGRCPGNESITVPLGDAVMYCYGVTNTGNGPAIDVVLVDDMATPSDPSDDVTLTLVGLTDEDEDSNDDDLGSGSAGAVLDNVLYDADGTYTNTVTATAAETSATATADATVTVDPVDPVDPEDPVITLTKSRIGDEAVTIGDDITYEIVATNDSVELTLDEVTILDDNAVITGCDQDMPATLAPGESLTCTAVHEVTAADVAAGDVVNVATVEGYEATTDSNLDGVASNAVIVLLSPLPVTGADDGLLTMALFLLGVGILVAVYSRRETIA